MESHDKAGECFNRWQGIVRVFQVLLSGNEYTYQCRRRKRPGFDPWVRKTPWRRAWQPTAVFLSAAAAAAKLSQSRLTLCDPIDGSPPGSAVPGILQARTLEWVAISFSNA